MIYSNSTQFSDVELAKVGGDINGQGITVEASSLRWSPGFFPEEVTITFPSIQACRRR
jgi:hypothetical protein